MSLSHYVDRLSVKRSVPPISFIDDDLSIVTHKHLQVAKHSQVGIEAKQNAVQKTLEKGRQRYLRARDARLKRIKEYRAENPDKVKKWAEGHYWKHRDKILAWRKANRDKCNEQNRRYRQRRFSAMTPEQKKSYEAERYQRHRKSMIEKHGLERWLEIRREVTRNYRLKKKEGKND
jgi:hypothetical protein